jgi:hypothetical protein
MDEEMKVNTRISVINDNNPPGSHPKRVTRLIVDGKHYLLDRAETKRLADSLINILDQNSFEALIAYRKRMDESR